MPRQQPLPEESERDASWSRELERGRLQMQAISPGLPYPGPGAVANAASTSVDPALMAGRRPSSDPAGSENGSMGDRIAELRDDARRAGSIAMGAATGGAAGAAAGAAKAAAEDAGKSAMNIATSKNPREAAMKEAAKAFKNWAVKPSFFTLPIDLIGPTIWAAPFKLLFLDIYGLLAATGRKGTIKYNVVELLLLLCYNVFFALLVIALLTLVIAAMDLIQCVFDLFCLVGRATG